MVEVGSLRKGMYIVLNGEIYRVIDVSKHTMARGRGIVRTKLKNIKTGLVRDENFNSGTEVEEATLELRNAQYLYNDSDGYYFMDMETFEQYRLTEEEIGDARFYLVDNLEVMLQFYEGQPIGVVLPNAVVLTVEDTEPAFKGDTVSGGGKPAVLETGLKITVPYFVEKGEKIKVDTRTGEYIERA
ncbi:MAG: elongation factor [Thermotogota bacterium]|nr:elongation factor [Thermotogota bacterium]MDK2864116.1 elongation factor [Thermotogota bacterium]HCZ07156.1 elongation factor P [Thermotogota bacterium]